MLTTNYLLQKQLLGTAKSIASKEISVFYVIGVNILKLQN